MIDLDKIDNGVKILNNSIDDVNKYRVKGQKINKKLINQFIDHIQKDPLLCDYILNLFSNVEFNKSEESNIVIEKIDDGLRLCKEIKTILPLYKGGMKENPTLYLMINGIERNIKEIKVMEEGK